MKIVHVITGLRSGGAENMLLKLLQNNKDDENIVISLSDKGDLGDAIIKQGITVHCLNMHKIKSRASAFIRFRYLIKKLNPDIIQAWMYHANFYTAMLLKLGLLSHKLVFNVRHTIYDLHYEKKLTAMIIKRGARCTHRASAVVYNSKISAHQHEALGYRVDKTNVIPNGFDIERFRPDAEKREKLRMQYQINDDVFCIGFIGRYHRQKDFPTFLAAAAKLVEKNQQVIFVVVGRDVNDENEDLVKRITALNLWNHVRLFGYQKNTHDIYQLLDNLTSCSSFGEGFSNVIGEAMACKLPCVATDVGDACDIIADTGVVIPTKNSDALVAAWQSLINLSGEERRKLGKKARQRIVENYALDIITDQYKALYASIHSPDIKQLEMVA